MSDEEINWTLIQHLAEKPHKHLNIAADFEKQLQETPVAWLGEVFTDSRTVHHLFDLIGIPEGEGDSAHVDARAWRAIRRIQVAEERLERIGRWHSRETAEGGMVGDYCNECGEAWPCDTRRMADGTYVDSDDAPGLYPTVGEP